MDDTYESLLNGISKLQEAWQDLNQANLTNEELKGLLFIAATEKSLSEGSWKCWLDIQNNHSGHPLSVFEARKVKYFYILILLYIADVTTEIVLCL